MDAIPPFHELAQAVLAGFIVGPILFGFIIIFVVLPTIALGTLLIGVLDQRLARPHPMDKVAVRRRTGVLLATLIATTLGCLRATVAYYDATQEPTWGIALIVAGLLQIGTAVVTLGRDAPYRRNGQLVATLAVPFFVGLGLVYARPLLRLIG